MNDNSQPTTELPPINSEVLVKLTPSLQSEEIPVEDDLDPCRRNTGYVG